MTKAKVLVLIFALFTNITSDAKKGAIRMKGEELIRTWLSAVDRARLEGYVAITDFSSLPADVRGDSSLWSERFFTKDANPHSHKGPVKCYVHLSTPATPDLLRFEYDSQSRHLTVVESNNFILVFIDPKTNQGQETSSSSFVESAAQSILDLHGDRRDWTFHLPPKLDKESLFSSNPTIDPLYLPDWRQRADGGIHNGKLFFLLYKKEAQYAGFENIEKWFDAEFRLKLH